MSFKKQQKAIKTLEFWFDVLTEVKVMEDKEHIQEYLEAIDVLKKTIKKLNKIKPV